MFAKIEVSSVENSDSNNPLRDQIKPRAWLAEGFNNSILFEKSESNEGDLFERTFMTGIKLDKFYTPLLVTLGFIGNGLSLTVLLGDPKHHRQSSSYYLAALAISDSGFLLNLLAVWLENFFGGFITNPLTCPMVMYLGQVTCFMSVYFTVAFKLERYIAIRFPFVRLRLCTASKAKRLISGIVATALVVFSYVWIIAEVVELHQSDNMNETWTVSEDRIDSHPNIICSVPSKYYKVSEVASYIDSAVTMIIPLILITCLNLGIGMSVRKISRQRNHLVSTNQSMATIKAKTLKPPNSSQKPSM